MSANENWDDDVSTPFYEKYKGGIAAACGLVAAGIIYWLASSVSIGDVHVSYIKKDYDTALDIAETLIERESDIYIKVEAKTVMAKIYNNKNFEQYDKNKALMMYQDVFDFEPSENTARIIAELMDKLQFKPQQIEKYWVYLAKKKDYSSMENLINLYTKNKDERYKAKAIKYLKQLPQIGDVKLKLAEIYLNKDSGAYDPSQGEQFLQEASRHGSGKAAILLALLNLEYAKQNKVEAASYIDKFVSFVTQGIQMGYRGEEIESCLNIINYGRYGVPRDSALVERLRGVIGEE